MNPCTKEWRATDSKDYEKQLQMKLVDAYVVEDIRDLRVKFDSNSQRVMVDFKSLLNYDDAEDVFELVPGEVRLEVYKAAKLGKLQQNIEIQIMADK
jgi:hypothetical protein